MIKNDYNLLISRLKESAYFGSTIALLHWDTEVKMPPKGNSIRAQTIAYMSSLAHKKFLEINSDGLLTKLKKAAEAGLGVGCLSKMAVRRELDNGWLIEISSPLNLQRTLIILTRNSCYITTLLKAFLALLKQSQDCCSF